MSGKPRYRTTETIRKLNDAFRMLMHEYFSIKLNYTNLSRNETANNKILQLNS